MKRSALQFGLLSLNLLVTFMLVSILSASGADGKKWDGKAYPFKMKDPSQPNSESNPIIIDTAGKLAYLGQLACNTDLVTFGQNNGLKGLGDYFKNNYALLTTDLDMNGAMFEFIAIPDTWLNFDGGGHVITNLRISNKKTMPVVDETEATCEIKLALFVGLEQIKNLSIGKGSTVSFEGELYSYKGRRWAYNVFAAGVAIFPQVMEGCYSEAVISIKGKYDGIVGGLAATCGYSMTNSYFRGSISVEGNIIDAIFRNKRGIERPGDLKVAGVCAQPAPNWDPIKKHGGIFGCNNTGPITVKATGDEFKIGGVAADVNDRCEFSDVYNTGKMSVTGTDDIKSAFIGGVVGSGSTSQHKYEKPYQYLDPGKIYNTGNINVNLKTGKKIRVGGISGGEEDKVRVRFHESSYNFGGIYGLINTWNTGSIVVSSSDLVENMNVGGLAGYGLMAVNSYNTGNISGNLAEGSKLNAGGIGGCSVYAQNCYNIGALTCKSAGSNNVGGVIGLANVLWGETETTKSTVRFVFWLHQTQSGGINSEITNGKGSYYSKPDEGEPSVVVSIAQIFAKKNKKANTPPPATSKASTGKIVEDPFRGETYYFESPTATVLNRSDDATGKRKAYEGTLLQALNERAQAHQDRKYHLWKIDGSNGGYPVFE